MGSQVFRMYIIFVGISCISLEHAKAKPTIIVSTWIHPQDKNLQKRLRDELIVHNSLITPEQYISEQFIATFSLLNMFEFTTLPPNQFNQNSSIKLILEISSGNDTRRWPSRDAELTMRLSQDREPSISFVLFRRANCGSSNCLPRELCDPSFYRHAFLPLILQWPSGMFHSIILATSAKYEQGGIIRAIEPISEFGQEDGLPPIALFEITFGNIQRQFVFCLNRPKGVWKALGRDQGTSSAGVPSCFVNPTHDIPSGADAHIMLLRAFPSFLND